MTVAEALMKEEVEEAVSTILETVREMSRGRQLNVPDDVLLRRALAAAEDEMVLAAAEQPAAKLSGCGFSLRVDGAADEQPDLPDLAHPAPKYPKQPEMLAFRKPTVVSVIVSAAQTAANEVPNLVVSGATDWHVRRADAPPPADYARLAAFFDDLSGLPVNRVRIGAPCMVRSRLTADEARALLMRADDAVWLRGRVEAFSLDGCCQLWINVRLVDVGRQTDAPLALDDVKPMPAAFATTPPLAYRVRLKRDSTVRLQVGERRRLLFFAGGPLPPNDFDKCWIVDEAETETTPAAPLAQVAASWPPPAAAATVSASPSYHKIRRPTTRCQWVEQLPEDDGYLQAVARGSGFVTDYESLQGQLDVDATGRVVEPYLDTLAVSRLRLWADNHEAPLDDDDDGGGDAADTSGQQPARATADLADAPEPSVKDNDGESVAVDKEQQAVASGGDVAWVEVTPHVEVADKSVQAEEERQGLAVYIRLRVGYRLP